MSENNWYQSFQELETCVQNVSRGILSKEEIQAGVDELHYLCQKDSTKRLTMTEALTGFFNGVRERRHMLSESA